MKVISLNSLSSVNYKFPIVYGLLNSTLAGSTIMLLTAAWAGSLVIGKCDLNAYGEAIEGSGYGKISCNKQVNQYQ